ncbi:MAG: hypothetical protein J6K98_03275, partial [Clostridia bacterium]|nr:hypothetical protein [Clostridia bacterium]
ELSPPIGPREHLNFLEKDAVATYIEGALQTIADAMPDFGECFDAVFTDEPALQSIYIYGNKNVPAFCSVPYCSELFDTFKRNWGYDLRPALPYLFFGDTVKARTVRVQYYRVISDLMRKNFTGQVAEWCHEHDIKYSGHMHSEEHMYYHVGNYGDYMEVMDKQDWTGCDILEAWPGYYWQKSEGSGNGSSFMTTKYTSSVSRGKGHNTTMVEICPVSHDKLMLQNEDTIYDSFMQLTTFMTFGGITHINAYGYPYIHSQEHHHHWNRYTGRLCAVLRDSASDAKIGVFYPIADIQASMYAPDTKLDDLSARCKEVDDYMESLVHNLYINRHDFNIITERMVNNSVVDKNGMTIGQTTYSVILIPDCRVISLAMMKRLWEFVQAGGKVHFLDRLPEMGITMDEHAEVARLALELSGGQAEVLRPDNLALGAAVTATSTDEAFKPENVTNGTLVTSFSWDGWRSKCVPAELTIQLEETTAFNRMDVYAKEDYVQRQYTVYYENDGQWLPLLEEKDNTKNHIAYEFPLVTTSRIKFVFLEGCEKQPDVAGLIEVNLYRVRHLEETDNIITQLHDEVKDPLVILEGKHVFVSRYRRGDTPFYYLINPSGETDHLRVCDEDGRALRLYDVDSGDITNGDELVFDMAPGRGVFVELR